MKKARQVRLEKLAKKKEEEESHQGDGGDDQIAQQPQKFRKPSIFVFGKAEPDTEYNAPPKSASWFKPVRGIQWRLFGASMASDPGARFRASLSTGKYKDFKPVTYCADTNAQQVQKAFHAAFEFKRKEQSALDRAKGIFKLKKLFSNIFKEHVTFFTKKKTRRILKFMNHI